MVPSIEMQRLTLPCHQVKSYKGLLKLTSALFQKAQNNIKLFFLHDQVETEIESEDDLMALKYMVRQGNVTFKVQLSSSKNEIENEMFGQIVEEFLDKTYDVIAEEEFMRELGEHIGRYLDEMYRSISHKQAKEKMRQVRNETVSVYLSSLNEKMIDSFSLPRRLPLMERSNRAMRVSPQNSLFRRKQSQVESMVSRILESMMPAMVKELSFRIIEELKSSKSQFYSEEEDLNPEVL